MSSINTKINVPICSQNNVFIIHIKVAGHWLAQMAQPKIHSEKTEFKTPSYRHPILSPGFGDTCYIDLFLKKIVLHINNQINH